MEQRISTLGGEPGIGYNAAMMPPVSLSDYQRREDDGSRWSRYQRYLDFFNGRQWDSRPRPGERRLTVNYARVFVHKLASYLVGKGVTVALEPNGSDAAAADAAQQAEAFLRQVWADNSLQLLDFDTAIDSAVLGDGAFKVSLQEGASLALDFGLPVVGAAKNSASSASSVIRVAACDVMGLSARWRGDDMRRLLAVTESYRLAQTEAAELFGKAAVVAAAGSWQPGQLVTISEVWDEASFCLKLNSRVVREQANPYGFIPYVIFPNQRRPRQFWGESDLVDVMALNSELNARVSVLSQILQMSGNPILVLENVDEAEGLRVGPGAVWTLPENSKAYLLDLLKDGGLDLHIKYIEALYRVLHDLSEMPRTSFGDNQSGAARSGVALEMMLQPLVQKILRKRQIWSEVIERRNRMILALAGLPLHRSRIEWPDILPKDRQALVTNEVALVGAGIHSREAAARNLGDERPDQLVAQVLAEAARFGK